MKKLLLTLAAVFMAVGLNAQSVGQRDFSALKVLERSTVNSGVRKSEARKVTLADNQRIMGAYTTDELAENGMGAPGGPESSMKAATKLTKKFFSKFIGGRIVMLRVGLCSAAEGFKLYVGTGDAAGNVTDLVLQDVGNGKKGWNEVQLTNPITIPDNIETLYLGFEYKQKSTQSGGGYTSDCYPLSLVKTTDMADFSIYGDLGSGTKWKDFGTQFGTLSVQAVVELDNIPDYSMVLNDFTLGKKYCKASESLPYKASVENFGKNKIDSYTLDFDIDGTKVGTYTSTKAIEVNGKYDVNGNITVPANIANGSHKVTMTLATINGQDVTGEGKKKDANFISFVNSVPRQKIMLEQFTSQSCTWCPLGGKFLKKLSEQRGDIAWAAIHGNMPSSRDKFNNKQCDSIMSYMGLNGFPSASYNRFFIPELLYKDDAPDAIVYGCGYKEQYLTQAAQQVSGFISAHAEAPSFVPVNITRSFNNETRELTVSVAGQGVEGAASSLAGYGLFVYITEDGLKAYQTSGGANYVHDHTFRAALGTVLGNDIKWNGNNYENNYTYKVPADYVTSNMHIIAFIAPKVSYRTPNHLNMDVNNCEITELEDPTGIEETTADGKNAEVVARYNAAGQQISAPETGVNILKLSNGKTIKVVVK